MNGGSVKAPQVHGVIIIRFDPAEPTTKFVQTAKRLATHNYCGFHQTQESSTAFVILF
jgi:hypothetical protein